jgi:hypothetical protein
MFHHIPYFPFKFFILNLIKIWGENFNISENNVSSVKLAHVQLHLV